MKRILAGILTFVLVFQLWAVPVDAAEPETSWLEEELALGEVSCDITYQGGAFSVAGAAPSGTGFLTYASRYSFDEAVEELYEQMLERKESIDISKYGILCANSSALIQAVSNEHPDLYYLEKWSYSYNKTTNVMMTVFPVYKDAANYDAAAFESAVNDALSVVSDDMTEMQKAIVLHDYIALNCEYDEHYQDSMANPNRHDIYGVFVDRVAVCQGYALAYKYLLNQLDIDCYMVTSETMKHAWNMVVLDGEHYQVDVTWDDPTNNFVGRVYHSYMFCSDETFRNLKGHKGWVVTYGCDILGAVATDKSYETKTYMGSSSPIIIDDENYYYFTLYDKNVNKGSIVKYDSKTETQTGSIYQFSDRWMQWQSSSSYWTDVYSGLFYARGRLWFNTPGGICSIKPDGTEFAEDFSVDTTKGYIYSSFLRGEDVMYQQETGPGVSVRSGKIYKADISLAGTLRRIVLSGDSLMLKTGGSAVIKAVPVPSYVSLDAIVWSSSDESVATVSDGTVTAVGEGDCVITASLGGISASCSVNVGGRLPAPEISVESGTVDKGQKVTVTAVNGANIYYTTDGTEPDLTSALYKKPISIDRDMTLRAIAAMDGFQNSETAVAHYVACTNELELDAASISATVGEEKRLRVTELPTTRTAREVEWSISDQSVAALNVDVSTGDALITAKAKGEAVVTAKVADHKGRTVTASCAVTVQPRTYQVIFVGEDGTELKKQIVEEGSAATAPTDVRCPDGYKLSGWDKDFTNVSGDLTVKAVLAPIVYTISYGLNGGQNDPGNPDSYDVTKAVKLADPTRERCAFGGWFSDAGFKKSVTEIPAGSTGNVVLYAKWILQQQYKVQFSGNAPDAKSDKTMETLVCDYEAEYDLPQNTYYRAGYEFIGWNTQPDGRGTDYKDGAKVSKLTILDNGLVMLYAQWKSTGYRITYHNMDAVDNPNPSWYTGAQAVILKDPVRAGHSFQGWYTDAGCSENARISELAAGRTGDIDLYAKWRSFRYILQFDKNHNKAKGSMSQIRYECGTTAGLPKNAYSLTGYTFCGWSVNPNGAGELYEDGGSVDGIVDEDGATVRLYAVWEPEKFTITYHDMPEDAVNENPETYDVKTAVKLSNPSCEGYVFKGWYSDPKYKKKVTSISKGSSGNRELYAKWKLLSYNVTYKANGGKGTSPDKVKGQSILQEIELAENPYTRKGYVFKEWNTKSNGKGKAYEPGATYPGLTTTDGKTITLYAVWTPVDYDIIYENVEYEDETITNKNPMVYNVTKTVRLSKPVRPGYVFLGWYQDEDFSRKISYIKKGSVEDKVLYAKWREKKYKIVYNANGGRGKAPAKESVGVSEEIVLARCDLTKPGYQFVGWNTKKNGRGISYEAGDTCRSLSSRDGATVKLYAIWERVY